MQTECSGTDLESQSEGLQGFVQMNSASSTVYGLVQ